MKINHYGIKDTCLGEYINTFNAENDDVALRSFKRDVNNAPAQVPVADFVLCRLGTFDKVNGNYENDYRFIISAVDCFKKEPVEE